MKKQAITFNRYVEHHAPAVQHIILIVMTKWHKTPVVYSLWSNIYTYLLKFV